ncbi:hypothetical protein P8452_34187 [Trifolium repens]|nr:hypothetical protein P8452_34187 [Trifolium repens]
MVMATICEELPPDSVMLVYLSASGKAGVNNGGPYIQDTKLFLRKRWWVPVLKSFPCQVCSREIYTNSDLFFFPFWVQITSTPAILFHSPG